MFLHVPVIAPVKANPQSCSAAMAVSCCVPSYSFGVLSVERIKT